MKIKNLKELKSKEVKELEKMVSKLRLELTKNQVKIAGGKDLSAQAGKNLKVSWALKKEIAQILTIIRAQNT